MQRNVSVPGLPVSLCRHSACHPAAVSGAAQNKSIYLSCPVLYSFLYQAYNASREQQILSPENGKRSFFRGPVPGSRTTDKRKELF